MNDKPRGRVTTRGEIVQAPGDYTADSFMNANARLGLGGGNMMDGSTYVQTYLTRNRVVLEAAYASSWIVGRAVDAPADDMTKEGVDFLSDLDPGAGHELQAGMDDLMVWQHMADGIRWGRLFGGSICYIMINGQDPATPLNVDSIQKGQFKGLLPLDRWVLTPNVLDLVKDLGVNFGLPKFYDVYPDVSHGLDRMTIHHSRVLRFEGVKPPWRRRVQESLWSISVIERLWDRLLAFDSATQGAAQLLFKAHLRTLKIEGYRNLLAAGGKMFEAVMQQVEHIRMFQSIEGLTVLDASDEFEVFNHTFAGLDDVLTQFGDQVCGAVEIPRTRMFGQSPAGLNSTGESDLKTYYEEVGKKQKRDLRRPVTILLDVMARSVLGRPLPDGFAFGFRPLWRMSEAEQATAAKSTTDSVVAAFGAGLISEKVGMQELKGASRVNGLFSNISDEDIQNAEDTIPDPIETAAALAEATNVGDPSQPGAEDKGKTNEPAKP